MFSGFFVSVGLMRFILKLFSSLNRFNVIMMFGVVLRFKIYERQLNNVPKKKGATLTNNSFRYLNKTSFTEPEYYLTEL